MNLVNHTYHKTIDVAVSDIRGSIEMKLKFSTLGLAILHKLGVTSPRPKLKTDQCPINSKPKHESTSRAEQMSFRLHCPCLLDALLPHVPNLFSNQPNLVSTRFRQQRKATLTHGTESSCPKVLSLSIM